jgi:acetyl-CoA C-acetyltransferase
MWPEVPGWTVMRNCASGMQSIDSADQQHSRRTQQPRARRRCGCALRAPLLFSDAMVAWLSQWYAAKTAGQRAALLAKFRPGYFAPVISLMKGLTDPICGLLMGQTAENLAYRFGITRTEMDAYSARSHARAIAARTAGTSPAK